MIRFGSIVAFVLVIFTGLGCTTSETKNPNIDREGAIEIAWKHLESEGVAEKCVRTAPVVHKNGNNWRIEFKYAQEQLPAYCPVQVDQKTKEVKILGHR